MECLRNYIGLRGCGLQEPESGYYVNSLPGISLESIDKLADSEQRSYAGVWADIVNRSLTKLETAVTSAFHSKFKLKAIQQDIVTNKKDRLNVSETSAVQVGYRGIILSLNDCQSPLLSYHVNKLRLYVPQAVTALKVVILDEDDAELWTSNLTTDSAGWQTIKVSRTFISRTLKIGFNSNVYAAPSLPYSADNSTDCFCDYYHDFRYSRLIFDCDPNCKATIGGWDSEGEAGNNHFGIIAEATLQCSFAPLICAYRQLFTEAYWYLLGSEIATERLYSPRFNWITANKDEANELKAFYDVEFEHAKNRAVKSIDLDLYDCCIVCNEPFKVIENRL